MKEIVKGVLEFYSCAPPVACELSSSGWKMEERMAGRTDSWNGDIGID